MDFSIYKKEQHVVIALKEHFDAEVSQKLKYIFDQLAAKITGDVLVNLKPVLFMDSTGIGTIVHMHKTLKKRQKRIFIIGAEGQPMGLLAMLKVNRVIPCLPTMKDYQLKYNNTRQQPTQPKEANKDSQKEAKDTLPEEDTKQDNKSTMTEASDDSQDQIEDLI